MRNLTRFVITPLLSGAFGKFLFLQLAPRFKQECAKLVLKDPELSESVFQLFANKRKEDFAKAVLLDSKLKRWLFKTLVSEYREKKRPASEPSRHPPRSFEKFSAVQIPQKIEGFHDLSFLFSSSKKNRGLIRMDFDEVAYLFKVIRSLCSPIGVEIGRFKGGSTFAIASAMKGGRLMSLETYKSLGNDGGQRDQELEKALSEAGLMSKVNLIVADSGTYDLKGLQADFLFIDGDHSYQGVLRDFEHWAGAVKPGGHVFFHDDHEGQPGVQKFLRELEQKSDIEKVRTVGTLSHYMKKENQGKP